MSPSRPAPGAEIVYGRRPVREAKRGRRQVRQVWTADEKSDSDLTRLAGSPEHQGIVAEVDPYPYADAGEFLEREDGLIVALDQVQDPHNLGAVCRSAEAAGAAGVVIPERRAAHVTPAACKASAGAIEHIPIARVRNLTDWLGEAKERGGWIYGGEGAGPVPYTQVDLTGRAVLVFGSEGKGLRPRVADACDQLISIPMRGSVGSLNVAAAAAVLLFEAVRQRGRV